MRIDISPTNTRLEYPQLPFAWIGKPYGKSGFSDLPLETVPQLPPSPDRTVFSEYYKELQLSIVWSHGWKHWPPVPHMLFRQSYMVWFSILHPVGILGSSGYTRIDPSVGSTILKIWPLPPNMYNEWILNILWQLWKHRNWVCFNNQTANRMALLQSVQCCSQRYQVLLRSDKPNPYI